MGSHYSVSTQEAWREQHISGLRFTLAKRATFVDSSIDQNTSVSLPSEAHKTGDWKCSWNTGMKVSPVVLHVVACLLHLFFTLSWLPILQTMLLCFRNEIFSAAPGLHWFPSISIQFEHQLTELPRNNNVILTKINTDLIFTELHNSSKFKSNLLIFISYRNEWKPIAAEDSWKNLCSMHTKMVSKNVKKKKHCVMIKSSRRAAKWTLRWDYL